MISLNNWAAQAVKKIDDERKDVSGNKEKAMAKAVGEAIKDFCRQNQEFAQAVAQGGSFANCMKAVADGAGNSISDLDAYRKAVQFFLPDAKVEMQLCIQTNATLEPVLREWPAHTEQDAPATGMILKLSDFF